MKKVIFLAVFCVISMFGFSKGVKADASKDGDGGPKVLSVYYYTNDLGKVFEFHVVSQADYRQYCNDYARRWDDNADDCVNEQGDCMDDVVIIGIKD
jgi:hypothetical protein